MVCQASGHRGCDSQGLVNAGEVVVDKVNRQRKPVVFDFLAESVCQAGKAPHLHPDREIVALGMARANCGFDGQSKDCLASYPGERVRAVFAFPLRIAINFDEHSVINRAGQECGLDRHKVSVMPVCAQLHAIGEAWLKVPHEFVCALGRTVANKPGRNQLGFLVNRDPCPGVAPSILAPGVNVLGLAPNKAPNFVALNVLARQAGHHAIREAFTGFAKLDKQAGDCALANAGYANSGTNAVSFHKASQHAAAVIVREAVHVTKGLGLVSSSGNPDSVQKLVEPWHLSFCVGHKFQFAAKPQPSLSNLIIVTAKLLRLRKRLLDSGFAVDAFWRFHRPPSWSRSSNAQNGAVKRDFLAFQYKTVLRSGQIRVAAAANPQCFNVPLTHLRWLQSISLKCHSTALIGLGVGSPQMIQGLFIVPNVTAIMFCELGSTGRSRPMLFGPQNAAAVFGRIRLRRWGHILFFQITFQNSVRSGGDATHASVSDTISESFPMCALAASERDAMGGLKQGFQFQFAFRFNRRHFRQFQIDPVKGFKFHFHSKQNTLQLGIVNKENEKCSK
jgi:hypothetical protein